MNQFSDLACMVHSGKLFYGSTKYSQWECILSYTWYCSLAE